MNDLEPHTHLAYVRVAGTNVHTDLGHGRIVFIHRTLGTTVGVVILLDDERMTYATLRAHVTDEWWQEIDAIREITRDEFDEVAGIARIRREMGWPS